MVGSTITGTAPIAADWNRSAPRVGAVARAEQRTRAVAFAGVMALMVAAPFERTDPLLRLPGQAISNLEAVLLAVFLAWATTIAMSRRLPEWRTPLTVSWIAWLAVLAAASLTAPAFRGNALHLTGRMTAALGVFLLTANGVATERRLIASMTASLAVAVVVAVVVVLEYHRVLAVVEGLKAFRPFMTMVGAQVRAGGPLQYPTIASMYLEIASACGMGLMLAAVDAHRTRMSTLIFAALVLVGYAVILTFTRAGLIVLAATFTLMFASRYQLRGADTGGRLIIGLAVVIALLFAGSQPFQSVWVRFTSETQNAWYRATVVAPESIQLHTGQATAIPVTVTNSGRVSWDSTASTPVFLSYHWMAPEQDRYVVFDGARTPFAAVVAPGHTITMTAVVRPPRDPGSYRLIWDVVLEHRLWFSSEPGAVQAISRAVVEGERAEAPAPPPPMATGRSEPRLRPGRFVLWRAAARMVAAHPVLGIGPDNFRLSYADYAGLPAIDRRMHSNNMYVEMLAGSGLAGGLAFGCLLAAAAATGAAAMRATTGASQAIAAGLAAALLAIAVHGLVDSFLSFAPMYIVFAITLGLVAACARGLESGGDAHRI